ncbi:hypothetical protein [Kitasatospora sp. NPDC004289]
MQFRRTVVAALGALTLLIAVPTSAHGATGEFLYKVHQGLPSGLTDPTSGVCINAPGATEDEAAYSPQNFTTSTATVFLELDCDGDTYFTMAPGKKLGKRLHFRSVVFS